MNREIILKLEQELTSAERASDAKKLELLLADDFIGVTNAGKRVDKSEFIANVCRSDFTFVDLTIEDITINIFGNIATVIGRSIFNVKIGDKIHNGSAQFIDVWRQLSSSCLLLVSSVTPEKQ